jgi:hypothetical protein
MTIVPFLQKVSEVILNPIILLLFGLSFVYFLYGIVRFLSLEYGDKARDEARKSIMWGIVGMVVMFSVFGLIRFVLGTFGISPGDVSDPARQFIGL